MKFKNEVHIDPGKQAEYNLIKKELLVAVRRSY
jgi:hypothetical protein